MSEIIDVPTSPLGDERPVIRCPHCRLNQFMTVSRNCRRCRRPLAPQPMAQSPGDELRSNLGAFVRDFRAARGMTRADLARQLGIDHLRDRNSLAYLEHGTHSPSLFFLSKVARGFGMSLSALISLVEPAQERHA